MDNEAQERRRKQKAAHMRAVRQREKELGQSGPKKRGRKPTDNPRLARKIYFTEAEWAFCKAQPRGGSEFVRQLVVDYIAEHGDTEGMVKSEDGGPVD